MIVRKSKRELEKMASAGRSSPRCSSGSARSIEPGVTTAELDRIAERLIRARGGVPTFKGYRGFPGSICASPNAMVVHGIPGRYRLEEGDLSRSTSASRRTASSPTAPTRSRSARSTPRRSDCSTPARPPSTPASPRRASGNRIGDISSAVQRVTEACRLLDRPLARRPRRRAIDARGAADPELRRAGARARARAGNDARDRADDHRGRSRSTWPTTAGRSRPLTASLAAHFEHTVAVTDDGPLILTAPSGSPRAARSGSVLP